MKISKTNAMRQLDQAKLSYTVHTYAHHGNDVVDGRQVAALLHQEAERVFKTLVTRTNTGEHVVFLLPVDKTLDLKKCARIVGVKHVSMIPVKDIKSVTGYIRGGCSPLGMKKQYRTFIHKSALHQKTICFSGGRIGVQIEMDPNECISLLDAAPVNMIKE